MPGRHTARFLVAATLALVLLVAACGDSDDGAETPETTEAPATTSTPTTAAPSPTEAPGGSEPPPAVSADGGGEVDAVLTIEGFEFSPIEVDPGATVEVRNLDSAPHTVSSPTAEFAGTPVDPQATASFTAPDEPGEYAFICNLHPAMSGTLVVG